MTRLAALFLLTGFFVSATAQGADAPNPSDVKIKTLSYSGTGCPKGSAAVEISPDLKAFTVLYSNYQVSVSDAKRRVRDTARCDVKLDLIVPDGWGFSIFTADYRGFVSLTQGATATQESHIRYNGIDPHQRFDSMDFKGPIEQDYLNRHTISAPLRVRSACKGKERHLELRSEITLIAAKGASGLMTVDSLDGEAENKFWITWQKCTK